MWENNIDKSFVKHEFNKLINVNDHLPYVIKICFTNLQWKQRVIYLMNHNIKDKEFHLLRKERRKARNDEDYLLFSLTEWLLRYPEFKGMLINENQLNDWIEYCENKYKINMKEYVSSNDDLKKLLKDLEE